MDAHANRMDNDFWQPLHLQSRTGLTEFDKTITLRLILPDPFAPLSKGDKKASRKTAILPRKLWSIKPPLSGCKRGAWQNR